MMMGHTEPKGGCSIIMDKANTRHAHYHGLEIINHVFLVIY